MCTQQIGLKTSQPHRGTRKRCWPFPAIRSDISKRETDFLALWPCIVFVHLDASYASETNSRSRAGGFFYLGWRHISGNNQINGGLGSLSKIMPNVLSSAAESEYASLFMNARRACIFQDILADLGFHRWRLKSGQITVQRQTPPTNPFGFEDSSQQLWGTTGSRIGSQQDSSKCIGVRESKTWPTFLQRLIPSTTTNLHADLMSMMGTKRPNDLPTNPPAPKGRNQLNPSNPFGIAISQNPIHRSTSNQIFHHSIYVYSLAIT